MATYRSQTGAVFSSSGFGVGLNAWPASIQTGDVVYWILGLIAVSGGTAPVITSNTPSDWVEVVNQANGSERLVVYRHTYTSGDSLPSSATWDISSQYYQVAIAYSSVSSFGTTVPASGSASGSFSVTPLPSGVARGSGLVLYCCVLNNAVNTTGSTGTTEREDGAISGLTGFSMWVGDQAASAAGDSQSHTFASASTYQGVAIPMDVGGSYIGATLSGVTFPLRHAGLGPFQSSAGNEYFFGRDSANAGSAEPHKATDPMSAFTAQAIRLMSSGAATAIEAMACIPDPSNTDLIHIVTQIATGAVYYNSYNMSSDTWGFISSEIAVAAASFAPSAGYTFVSLAVRSNGEVDVGYCAGLTAMSSGFHMVRYTRRTATNTWSAPVNVDNGGSIDWNSPIAVLGTSDRVHFFLADRTNGNAYQRTLTAANVLQTFPASFDFVTVGAQHSIGPGSSLSGTVVVPLTSTAGSRRQSVARLTSSDAPTVSSEAVANQTDIASQGQSIQALSVAGVALHYLYPYSSTPTNKLGHDNDGGSGAWGADVDEWAVTSLIRITNNFYFRGGLPTIGMVVDENGTVKYAEIAMTLPAAPTGLTATLVAE